MTVKEEHAGAGLGRGETLMAMGGLLGVIAASSCCILPLVLFSLGLSGAWIGAFTQLAPYQPYFMAATVGFLGTGYWLVYRSSKLACAEDEAARIQATTALNEKYIFTLHTRATQIQKRAFELLGINPDRTQ